MKLSAVEEYGMRCLVQMAQAPGHFLTISAIAEREGLSVAYVSKLVRILKRGGLVCSIRGQRGGVRLARAPGELDLLRVLDILGGRVYPEGFCGDHAGDKRVCVHDGDCSLRVLWTTLDAALQRALGRMTLAELCGGEKRTQAWLRGQAESPAAPPSLLRRN